MEASAHAEGHTDLLVSAHVKDVVIFLHGHFDVLETASVAEEVWVSEGVNDAVRYELVLDRRDPLLVEELELLVSFETFGKDLLRKRTADFVVVPGEILVGGALVEQVHIVRKTAVSHERLDTGYGATCEACLEVNVLSFDRPTVVGEVDFGANCAVHCVDEERILTSVKVTHHRILDRAANVRAIAAQLVNVLHVFRSDHLRDHDEIFLGTIADSDRGRVVWDDFRAACVGFDFEPFATYLAFTVVVEVTVGDVLVRNDGALEGILLDVRAGCLRGHGRCLLEMGISGSHDPVHKGNVFLVARFHIECVYGSRLVVGIKRLPRRCERRLRPSNWR